MLRVREPIPDVVYRVDGWSEFVRLLQALGMDGWAGIVQESMRSPTFLPRWPVKPSSKEEVLANG